MTVPIRAITSAGPTAQPTRSPVAANALEMPSTRMVYFAISGTSSGGVTCRVEPTHNGQ